MVVGHVTLNIRGCIVWVLVEKFRANKYKVGSTKGQTKVGSTRQKAEGVGSTKREACRSRRTVHHGEDKNCGELNVESYQQTWEKCSDTCHLINGS